MKFFIRSIKKRLMQSKNREPKEKSIHQFYVDVIFTEEIMSNNAYIFLLR